MKKNLLLIIAGLFTWFLWADISYAQNNNKEDKGTGRGDSQSVTEDQKASALRILSKYKSTQLSAEDAKAIHKAMRDIGIHGGPAEDKIIESAGIDVEILKKLDPPPDKLGGDNKGDKKSRNRDRNEGNNAPLNRNDNNIDEDTLQNLYNDNSKAENNDGKREKPLKKDGPKPDSKGGNYSIEQAMSDNAQLSTIAFSGLAFLTGSAGADTFFPPGKVADFFGFQYMRDVDTAGYGHNTTFLTKAASNVLHILSDAQKAKLVALAKEQAPVFNTFAYNRFLLTHAFRRNLEGKTPAGTTDLDSKAVSGFTAGLYQNDADLSYNRALVMGEIINSLTDQQKAYLAKMKFNNSATWPDLAEDETLKRSMNNTQFVAVMTYASELFSWYKGGKEADIYFCPERHGTYFGGFFMKDYPAMHNPNYFISTSITGDSGKAFLNTLNPRQRSLITGIIDEQRPALSEIKQIRTDVSAELRKAMTGGSVDKGKVYSLIKRYGQLDGQMSALYASRFSAVNKTLTPEQRASLVKLRNLDAQPQGAYRFSTPVAMPDIPNTDFMFGKGALPENAGQITPPESFGNSGDNRQGNRNKPPKAQTD